MQLPQIFGILIGVCFIFMGVLVKRHFSKNVNKTLSGVLLSIAIFIGITSILQNLLYSYSTTWTWRGVVMIWGDFLGTALVPIFLGLLGLFYKPNRTAGYVAALVIFFFLVRLGSEN